MLARSGVKEGDDKSGLWSARVLAAELRSPLVTAAHTLQLARLEQDLSLVDSAEQAIYDSINTIEQFVSTSTLIAKQLEMELEPLSIGAILDDAAHQINKLAKTYQVEVVVHAPKTYLPIVVHRVWTARLLANLAVVFVHMPLKKITLGAHRTSAGIRGGVFAEGVHAAEVLRQARLLTGESAQPMRLSNAGAANLVIADRVGKALRLSISSSIHARQSGIAITLPWSKQLTIV